MNYIKVKSELTTICGVGAVPKMSVLTLKLHGKLHAAETKIILTTLFSAASILIQRY
jgi:hypothetical protein